MATTNQPRLATSTLSKQEIKTELARGFVIALGLGAMLFYFVLFPAPFKQTEIVEKSSSLINASSAIGDEQPRSGELQFQTLSSCLHNNYSIISPINHGKRLNFSNFDQIAYVMDSGNTMKVWASDYLDCGDHGALIPQTLIGERADNVMASAVVGNITGNDYNEIVVSTGTTVEAYDMIGNEKWIWTPSGNETVDFAPPILADFHPTPEGLEILAMGHEGNNLHLYYLDGATGQLMSAGAHQIISNVSSKNPVSVADVTNDYTPGVIVASDTTLYFLNNQGQQQSNFSLPSSSLHTPPMAISEDNPYDGYVFIAYNEGSQTKIYGWYHHFYFGSMRYELQLLDESYPYWDENHQNTYHWPKTVSGNLNLSASQTLTFANLTNTINPVTNTENPDIVFVTTDNKLHGYSHFGDLLFTADVSGSVNGNSQPVAFDYDNDGYDELFVTTETRIWAYEQNGSLINNDIFPIYIEDEWGSGSIFSGPLSIIYNGQYEWPIFSVPIEYGNGSSAWQFSVWTIGQEYQQPSFAGVGGSIHNTNSYNFCRINSQKTAIGECSSYYGTTGANSYCTGGTYLANCYLCGCPSCYDCPGINNQCYYTCGGSNPPPSGGCGGSPVMLKGFIECTELLGGGGY